MYRQNMSDIEQIMFVCGHNFINERAKKQEHMGI